MRRLAAAVVLAVLVVLGVLTWRASAPGTGVPDPSPRDLPTPAASGPALQGEIVVLAAASLTEAFTVLADRFTVAHPDVTVTTSYGPSSSLAAQVAAGAPVDVLATADERTMELALTGLAGAGAVDATPVVFAKNSLAIAVPVGNPGEVGGLEDLARTEVTFAVCREEVPCGSAAARVLAAAGIDRLPVTYESDARGVLTKVLLGEVDAGLVYASDVRPTSLAVVDGQLIAVPLPDEVNTTTAYPLVALPGAGDDAATEAFVDFVLSDEGAQVLRDAGFVVP